MIAYRKFSDTPQTEVRAPIPPKPAKVPKVDPIEPPQARNLGGLGALGGVSGETENPPVPAERAFATWCEVQEEHAAAIVEHDGCVRGDWADGYAALSTMSSPTGFARERWRRIVDATGRFLDRWSADAIRCGWTDLDVFGANPDRPDARFDAMGLVLMLDRAEVIAVDAEGATLRTGSGSELRYRRRSMPDDTIRLWDLVTEPRGRP